MIRFALPLTLVSTFPSQVLAHAGHLGELAGHDHLVAGAALGIAIVIGVAGALAGKARDKDEAEPDDSEEAPEPSEA